MRLLKRVYVEIIFRIKCLAPVRFICRRNAFRNLALGDPITGFYANGNIAHGKYIGAWSTGSKTPPWRFYWSHSYGTADNFENEGLTWIRGHHAPDSKEVAGLRVALALGHKR